MSHKPLYQAHAAPIDRHWNRRRLFLLMIALMVLSLGAVGLGRGFEAPTGTTAGAMEIEAGGSGGARTGLLTTLRDTFGGEPNKSQAPATTATTVIAPSPVATVEVHVIASGGVAVPGTATGARMGTDVASVIPPPSATPSPPARVAAGGLPAPPVLTTPLAGVTPPRVLAGASAPNGVPTSAPVATPAPAPAPVAPVPAVPPPAAPAAPARAASTLDPAPAPAAPAATPAPKTPGKPEAPGKQGKP